jgi:hypothetical protein
MATLTGNSVGSSYLGLLKTTDNAAIGATEKNLTDGAGNASTLSIGTASASFTGTLDLAGATVTGLPAGAPGLVQGDVANSMVSAASLTTTPALATSGGNIAIGSNAQALGATNFNRNCIAIGTSSYAFEEQNVSIGYNARTTGNRGLSIGTDSISVSSRAAAVGFSSQANNFAAVCLGDGNANGESSVSIGGFNTLASPAYSVAIGRETQVPSNIAKGMAMGYQVTAIWANALTIPQIAFTEVANLNYADQAAAVTGGVPVGGVYHTDGTLKIVY